MDAVSAYVRSRTRQSSWIGNIKQQTRC